MPRPQRGPTIIVVGNKPAIFTIVVGRHNDGQAANGYDGIVRVGRPDMVVTASGNVVIVINGIRVTADTAVWHLGAMKIELGDGVHLELPARPTSITMKVNLH